MPTFRRGAAASQGSILPPTLPGTPVGAASAADGWDRGSAATATPAAAALCFPRAATTAMAADEAEGVCPRPTVVGVTPVRSPSIALPRAASAASTAPAAAAAAVATPEMLWVVSPEMPEAAGCFALQRSETVNGMPTWRCAQRWLYCNSGGGWMLAADADDVRCNRGWAASAAAHGGRLPHQHGAWEAADGRGGWQALRHLRVTDRPPLLPARVTVRSPSHPEVSGEYALSAPGDHRNGFAYWACGEKRLYSGEGGWWLVDPDQKHMELDRGLLASTHKHGGLSPTEMETWEVADGQGGWLRDERCVVAPAPAPAAPAPVAAAAAATAAPATHQAAPAPAAEDELEQLRMRTLERERKMMEEINGLRDQLANAKASKGLLQADFDAAEEAARRLRSEALDRSSKEAGLQAATAAAASALEKEKAASAALREAAAVLERDAAEVEKEVAFTRKDLASARALATSLRHEVRQRGKLGERQRREAASAAAASEALLRGARGEAAAARAELAAAHEVNAAVTGRCAEQEARADAAEAALAEERVARRRHVDAVRAAAEAAVQAATDSLLLVVEGAAADAAAVRPLPQPLPLPAETVETVTSLPVAAEEELVATAAAAAGKAGAAAEGKAAGGEKVRSSRRTDSPKGKKSAQILKRASAAKSALAGWAPHAAAAEK